MERIGIDLGKFKSDVCVMKTAGAVTERFRLEMSKESLERHFANRPISEIAIEAGRDSRWVHEVLTGLGHQVRVMDTTQARAMGVGRGKRKTNRRDAEALARALWTGCFPQAHVLSARTMQLRDTLAMRRQLVACRTSLVTALRGQFQAQGWRAPKCAAKDFPKRLRASEHELVRALHVQTALSALDEINVQIVILDRQLVGFAQGLPSYERLKTAPGTKLVVGLTFIAALDDANRFKKAHQVQAYLGLVPGESSTGDTRHLGSITKAGNSEARAMLIQAAWAALRSRKYQDDPLVTWMKHISQRRGRRIAVVALARRLSGVLWAMWRDGTVYDAKHVARGSAKGLAIQARQAQANENEMRAATLN